MKRFSCLVIGNQALECWGQLAFDKVLQCSFQADFNWQILLKLIKLEGHGSQCAEKKTKSIFQAVMIMLMITHVQIIKPGFDGRLVGIDIFNGHKGELGRNIAAEKRLPISCRHIGRIEIVQHGGIVLSKHHAVCRAMLIDRNRSRIQGRRCPLILACALSEVFIGIRIAPAFILCRHTSTVIG